MRGRGGMRGRGAYVAGGMHGGGGEGACHAHPLANTTRYGDTVNERAVRILLENHSCSYYSHFYMVNFYFTRGYFVFSLYPAILVNFRDITAQH